jgi:energy-coupling factor transport system permease protein
MSEFEFLRSMPFAEFSPRDIWLQKIDPRAFLLSFFFLLTAFIFTSSIPGLILSIGIVLLGIFLSQVKLKVYLKGFFFALPFILILAVINIVFNSLKDVAPIYFQWKFLAISWGDIQLGIKLILRFAAMMLLISLVSSNLSTSRFIHGLESLFSPINKIGIPVYDFIISIEIAIRFIPILTLTAERIAKAQASRGASWGSGRGSLMARIRQVIPVIVPLFIQSLHKAEALSLAMDSRGFGAVREHTNYTRSEFKWTDGVFTIICLVLAVLVLFVV